MNLFRATIVLIAFVSFSGFGHAEDAAAIKKAVARSTLNQPGTKPFHLKAELAPSLERDKDSGRTGAVEIWWSSPTQWRREVRSPEFHQLAILSGGHEWQKNEGDYFPEWLRENAVALVQPVPNLDQVLAQVQSGESRKLMGMIHFSWMMMSTNGDTQKAIGGSLAISDNTGLLLYGGGFGWGGEFKEYETFHGRMVARVVKSGSPEVTATVTTLEDLRDTPSGFFDTAVPGADSQPLRTVLVDEAALRKNLLAVGLPVWPPLQDGPLEGAVTTTLVVDRTGKVREVGTIVADNPGVLDAAREAISAMQFHPYLDNGNPVQVVARLTMPFKTVRPAGTETFQSAQAYFERGRKVGFPAAGTRPGYSLQASFQAGVKAGTVETGQYTDTWESDFEWRREATIGQSRFVRVRHGEKRYQLEEGPDVPTLRLVLRTMEPIPALDTFVESDWKIQRDTVDAARTIRVLTGYVNPEGKLDPDSARAYWFDDNGNLLKTYFAGIETRRSQFEEFSGTQIAHEVKVLRNDKLGMLIRVTQVSPLGSANPVTNDLRGHEWKRAFTDEVR
jgi:hypothetical protein